MKKVCFILSFLVLAGSTGLKCQTSLYNNVVAYWKLDESSGATTAADALGNYPGTITAATCGAAGKINTCYTFASGKYITFSTSSSLDLGASDVTISAWIKTTSAGNQVIISKHSNANGYGYFIGMNNGYPYVELVGSAGTTVTALGECQYNDGYWHLMTVIFDRDGYLTIYIDTEIEAQENISSISGGIYSTQNLFIAHSAYYTSRSFIGSIDEVYIWNRVLTDQEVANYLYNGGTGRSYPFGYIAVTGVVVSPSTAFIGINETAQLSATVTPTNATDKTITWTSDDEVVATVSSSGLVTGLEEGPAAIIATTSNGSVSDNCLVTVIIRVTGVTVTPASTSVNVGKTVTISAAVSPTNAYNKDVAWTSSNTSVATVSSSGVVTGIAAGTAIITATTNDGSYTASSTVTVKVPVTGVMVSPTTTSVDVGETVIINAIVLPTNATNKTVSWSSGNTAVATVSSGGVVTGISAGTATITVTTNDGSYTATSSVTVTIPVTGITVTPTTASIIVGETKTFSAVVSPANATNKSVSWSSDNSAVATVNSGGVVTGVAAGLVTITATTHDGSFTAICTVTVTIPVTGVTVTPTTATIAMGETLTLNATVSPANATDQTITWSSGNTAVITVSSSGVVTGVGAGNASVTVTTHDGAKTATSAITVIVPVESVSLPTTASVALSGTLQLKAALLPANATDQTMTWSSGNTGVASVSAGGLVTGNVTGTTTITVTTTDGAKTATCTVTVTSLKSWLNNGDDIYYSFGNVGVGSVDPQRLLAVNGNLVATERIVVVSAITSDFVFEPEYDLMPLTELERYIKCHKHLPGIPSAKEFSTQKQNLAKMDDLLLRKIEELTLYVIELEKEVEDLKTEK